MHEHKAEIEAVWMPICRTKNVDVKTMERICYSGARGGGGGID